MRTETHLFRPPVIRTTGPHGGLPNLNQHNPQADQRESADCHGDKVQMTRRLNRPDSTRATASPPAMPARPRRRLPSWRAVPP